MPTWDPRQYLRFADHRLRPALDLMAQIPLENPRTVYDLGCGPGNITRLLAERWPGAQVVGVDSSAEMLVEARQDAQNMTFVQTGIEQWASPEPADLLFTNSTLQWLDDHARLFPRLVAQLGPQGVLAVQMPHNHEEPSHAAMREAAEEGPWRDRLHNVRSIRPVGAPADYYRILAPISRQIDIWETEYLHVLEGDNPVVEWTKGTGLWPYLDALQEPERGAFLAAYAARIAGFYPKQPDGRTLLSFRRLFILTRI
jgi:trans-aconitate 2-methyltransferase